MSELASLQTTVDEVRGDVKHLLQSQAGTAAKLDLMSRQHDSQIAVLFDKHGDDAERIRTIELDYVRSSELRRHTDGEHATLSGQLHGLEGRLVSVEAKVIRLSLIAGVVVAVIQFLGYGLTRKWFG